MNKRDVVVRIIQPAEQPKAQPIEHAPAAAEKPKKNHLLNTLAIMAISALVLYLVFGLFNVGIALREIVVLVGIPLTVGLVTTYAIV